MAPGNRSGQERLVTAGILILALALAWMIIDRPEQTPVPKKAAVVAAPAEPQTRATVTSAEIASALAIELVQISEPPPAPPTPAPAPQIAPPSPSPQRDEEQPPPTPVRMAPPIPDRVPLRPIEPVQEFEVMPSALRAEVASPAPVVPLRPSAPKAQPQAPAMRPSPRPEPQDIKPQVTPIQPARVRPLPQPEMTVAIRAPPPPQEESSKVEPGQNVSAVVGEGRAFLKILEQGAGPAIEIRWPSDSAQRDRLYRALVQCLGMRTGLLDGQGRLYLGEGAKGQASTLDGERYSGFVRRPEGAIAQGEQREIARVRGYHNVSGSASPARIFPRRVDAYLIGGLRGVVGDSYLKTKAIRATYRLKNNQPFVDSIVADGRRIDGAIDLSAVANSCSV